MDKVLIVDVETNGLDPRVHQVVEVGAIVYSVTHQTTLMQFSTLLHAPHNECEHVNRIPSAAVAAAVKQSAIEALGQWLDGVDAIVAHNADFDRQWFPGVEVPWLCTMSDFKWPRATRDGGALINLALEHGIGVSTVHRALPDCQLIAALFDRMTDLPAMFAQAMRPKAMFRANVSFEERDLAKEAGFKWDGAAKTWTRRMAIEDAAALPFKTIRIGEC